MNQIESRTQNFRDNSLLGARVLLCSSILASSAIAAPAVTAPPPLKIDLNAFDASKKTIALANGESLAYIERGEHSGPAVVLIHGYTDNARDWVPVSYTHLTLPTSDLV